MSEQTSDKKYVVPVSVVEVDGKRAGGKEACKLVKDYVKKTWPTLSDDTEIHYWTSEWSNQIKSMVMAENGTWNGTFRTKLGYALNNRTQEEVTNAKGTKSGGDAPAGTSTGTSTGTRTRRPASRDIKLNVEFNTEDGTARVVLGKIGEGDTAINCELKFAAETGVVSYNYVFGRPSAYALKILTFVEDPRAAFLAAVEIDSNGTEIQPGWKLGNYQVALATREESAPAILKLAIDAKDLDFMSKHMIALMSGDTSALEQVGQSKKMDWLDMWFPAPVVIDPVSVPDANQPSELPADPLDVAQNSEEGLTVTPAETPAKK